MPKVPPPAPRPPGNPDRLEVPSVPLQKATWRSLGFAALMLLAHGMVGSTWPLVLA